MSFLSWVWDTYTSFFLFDISQNCNAIYNGTLFVISGTTYTDPLDTIYYTSLSDPFVRYHGSKLIIGTIFIGFYPTVDIAQSN